jgi:Diacylglycerol kinase accessory domain
VVGGLRSSLAGGASLPAPSTKAMNNYMGIGIDAKVALEFHQMRDQVPPAPLVPQPKCAGPPCAVTAFWLPALGNGVQARSTPSPAQTHHVHAH